MTQRPDGKGAMVNSIEPGGQAATFGIGDGWAISHINNVEVLEMPFVKDFNEIGAGTKAGVTAIAEILGSLNAPFNMEFVGAAKAGVQQSHRPLEFGSIFACHAHGEEAIRGQPKSAMICSFLPGTHREDSLSCSNFSSLPKHLRQ